MADINMCKNGECPISDSCHRFTATAIEHWQTYSDFQFDLSKRNTDICEDYWNNGKCWHCGLDNGNHKMDCRER